MEDLSSHISGHSSSNSGTKLLIFDMFAVFEMRAWVLSRVDSQTPLKQLESCIANAEPNWAWLSCRGTAVAVDTLTVYRIINNAETSATFKWTPENTTGGQKESFAFSELTYTIRECFDVFGCFGDRQVWGDVVNWPDEGQLSSGRELGLGILLPIWAQHQGPIWTDLLTLWGLTLLHNLGY